MNDTTPSNGHGKPPGPRLALFAPSATPVTAEAIEGLRRELRAVRRAIRRLVPPETRAAAARAAQAGELTLRTVHRKLHGAATLLTCSAKTLARRAGYAKVNSRHRKALADLVRAGLLVHTPDGYRLPAEKGGDSCNP